MKRRNGRGFIIKILLKKLNFAKTFQIVLISENFYVILIFVNILFIMNHFDT